MVFPVVMYGCESWTVKKAEHWRMDAFELWCWRRLWRVPWTARRSNPSILKEISPECSLEGLMLKLKFQYSGHLMWRTDSFEKTLMLGKTEGGRRRGQQRMGCLDGITGVWVNSRSWWWTWRPGVLQSMGSQLRYDWATELNLWKTNSGFVRQCPKDSDASLFPRLWKGTQTPPWGQAWATTLVMHPQISVVFSSWQEPMGLLRKLVHSCCDSTCEGTFTNSLLKNHGCSTTPGGSTKNLRPEEGGRETLSILFSTSDAVREALLLFFSGFTKWLLVIPWTVAHQAPLSMGFPRQEQWSVLPEEMVFNNGIVVFISMCVLRCKRSAASLYFPWMNLILALRTEW